MIDNLRKINGYTIAALTIEYNLRFVKSGSIIEETGKNDSEQLDKIQSVWGLKREPYCAMGQFWVFAKVLADQCGIKYDNNPKSNIYCVKVFKSMIDFIEENYLKFDPSCGAMINFAKSKNKFREFRQRRDMNQMIPGDYIFYDFSDNPRKPMRHIEQFIKPQGDHIITVGWNTGADSNDPARETNDPAGGGGCFIKVRKPNPNIIIGYIRWQS